ncbi:MAG: class I SAM-dependent methyltransferase [Cuniculiplasma divulgatum]|nr:MAG: class I SAM-dependent methyltransferase [Cuniculiplasma divulgatum]
MKQEEQKFYENIHEKFWGNYGNSDEIALVSLPRLLKCKTLIEKVKPRKMLNLGFESVEVARFLTSEIELHPENYILVDIDRMSVTKAKDAGFKSISLDLSHEILPFSDNHFDLVYMGELIEHLLNPDFSIREIYRVTKSGGKIIITTPNLASWYNRILLLAGMAPINIEVSTEEVVGRKFKFLGNGSPPVGHIRLFTERAMVEFLQKKGIYHFHIIGYERGDVKFDRLFSKFPSIASGIIVEITKV